MKIPIFRPELSLEMHLASKRKKSVLKICDTDDVIVVLEGIKDLTTDHLAIIYLDNNDNLIEIDTFLKGIDEFTTEQSTRALASVIYNQNSGVGFKVILAQTVHDNPKSLADYINIKNLANFAARLLMVNVELLDCILIGETEYFSFKRDKNKWIQYGEELQLRKEILGDGGFLPNLIDEK